MEVVEAVVGHCNVANTARAGGAGTAGKIVLTWDVVTAAGAANIDGSGDYGKVRENLTLKSLGRVSIDGSGDIAYASEDVVGIVKNEAITVFDTATGAENLTLTSLGRADIFDTVNTQAGMVGHVEPGEVAWEAGVVWEPGTVWYDFTLDAFLPDGVAVSEDIAGSVSESVVPITADIFDSASAAEDVVGFIPNEAVTVFDIASASELLALSSLGRASIFDTVSSSDFDLVNGKLKQLVSEVFDSVGVSELLALSSLGRTDIFDTVSAAEDIAGLVKNEAVLVFDTTTASELLTLSSLGRADIFDTAESSELLTLTSLGRADIFDIGTGAEDVVGDIVTPDNSVDADIFDSTAVSESLILSSLGRADIYDLTNVSEDITGQLSTVGALNRSVYDELKASEYVSLTSLGRTSIFDTTKASENLSLSSLGRASIFDSVTASESLSLTSLGRASIYDTASASENLALTSLGRASVFDIAAISESVIAAAAYLVSSLVDNVSVPEFLSGGIEGQTPVILWESGVMWEPGTEWEGYRVIGRDIHDDVSISESIGYIGTHGISEFDKVVATDYAAAAWIPYGVVWETGTQLAVWDYFGKVERLYPIGLL